VSLSTEANKVLTPTNSLALFFIQQPPASDRKGHCFIYASCPPLLPNDGLCTSSLEQSSTKT